MGWFKRLFQKRVYHKPAAPPKDAVVALQRRKDKIKARVQKQINRKRIDRGAEPITFSN